MLGRGYYETTTVGAAPALGGAGTAATETGVEAVDKALSWLLVSTYETLNEYAPGATLLIVSEFDAAGGEGGWEFESVKALPLKLW